MEGVRINIKLSYWKADYTVCFENFVYGFRLLSKFMWSIWFWMIFHTVLRFGMGPTPSL